ncbi:MAG TPA: hypothetical protein VFB58_04765 [Chloroflexota bacterium]|nr:hypothetical protein [Chloroflexota bacterium]
MRLSRVMLVLLVIMALFNGVDAHAAGRALSPQAANLLRLHMETPAVGWAMSTTGLLRTTDGSLHWRVVTPPALGRPLRRSPYALVTDFLGVQRAWVGIDNAVVSAVVGRSKAPTTLRLFRTDDGGRYWQALPLLRLGTFYYADAPQFVSPDVGWLEIVRNVGAGSVWFDLYWTHDGGIHWQRVLHVGSPHSSPGLLGCDLCSAGLTFSSHMSGWFTGCWCGIGTGSSFLYVSRNAGRTWRPLSLPAPSHIRLGTIGTLPPTLFDRDNGILPAVVYQRITTPGRERAFFDAYVTHDGGRHWTPTTPVPISYPRAGPEILHSFPNTRFGFFVIGKQLYRTRDGGKHWQAIPESIPLEHSETMQFLDGHHGFALQAGDTQGTRSILLRTGDGGATWKIIRATVGTYRARIHRSSQVSYASRTYRPRAVALLSSHLACSYPGTGLAARPHCR